MSRAEAPPVGTMPPVKLGPMPTGRAMTTIDEAVVRAPLPVIFELARDVERWPEHLSHYRFVRFTRRDGRDGGLVEMSANRPFGVLNWPTFWRSEMETLPPDGARAPAIRFRHNGGITTGMVVVSPTSGHGGSLRLSNNVSYANALAIGGGGVNGSLRTAPGSMPDPSSCTRTISMPPA